MNKNSDFSKKSVSISPHRVLSIDDYNIAMIGEYNNGWCILPHHDYSKLIRGLNGKNILFSDYNLPEQKVIMQLWKAGLILFDGNGYPLSHFSNQDHISLLLKLTGKCNYSCSYCYDYDSRRFNKKLSFAQITETLDYLFPKQKDLLITFHGGEPLLQFDLIKDIVEYVCKCCPHETNVSYSIQTNGSLFSNEILTFLDEHKFSVGISLDGNNEYSNRLRHSNNSLSVLKTIEKFVKENQDFVTRRCGFLAVIHKSSAPFFLEYIDWLQNHGVDGLTIAFLDLEGRARANSYENEYLTPLESVSFTKEVIDGIRSKKITLRLKPLTSMIGNMHNLVSQSFCNKGPCGASSNFLVLDASGAYRVCDCTYNKFLEVGSLSERLNSLEKLLLKTQSKIIKRHEWLRTNHPKCSACSIFSLCGGTCVAKTISNTGTSWGIDPRECAISTYIYNELLKEFMNEGTKSLFDYYRSGKKENTLNNDSKN